MAKSLKGVWLISICLLLVSCGQLNQLAEAPQAVEGWLDLRDWDFNRDGMVNLAGEWEFHWRELLSPSEIETKSDLIYVPVPEDWTTYEIDGQPLPPEGFATFRLVAQLQPQTYGLFIDGEGTAYSLWVDGKLIAQNGRVGTNKDDMTPQRKPEAVFFSVQGGETELVIQISNWHHRKAGFRSELLLGLPTQVHEYRRDLWAQDAFVMGIYLIMGVYHIFIFALRPTGREALYFAIWSFLNLIRAGLLNQKIFVFLFPAMSWAAALKIEYLTFYFSSFVYAVFLYSIYPRDIPRWVVRTIFGLGLVFSVFMLFTNTLTASKTVPLYQGVILIEITYFAFFIVKIVQNKRDGATIIAFGSVIAFLGVIGEILYLQNISPLKISSVYAFLVFIMIQAVLLASRLSKSFQHIEVLSTELEETNISLSESEKKYRAIFEESKDMIFIARVDESIIDANPASEDIIGYTSTELQQMKMSDILVHQQDKGKIENTLRELAVVKDYELELRRKDGSTIHGLLTLTFRRDETGKVTELQGNVHDISSRIQAQNEQFRAMMFEQMAITDPLTNIYNRRVFDEIAVKEWERAKRSKSLISMVLFDIDHFKQVNDTYGHLLGDQVLTNLASLCLSNMRNMDIFARYGGEEFVIIMPDTNSDSAHQTIERLRIAIEKTHLATHENEVVFVTISAGIATWNGQDSLDLRSLLYRADQALYISKEAGRNQVTVWKAA